MKADRERDVGSCMDQDSDGTPPEKGEEGEKGEAEEREVQAGVEQRQVIAEVDGDEVNARKKRFSANFVGCVEISGGIFAVPVVRTSTKKKN